MKITWKRNTETRWDSDFVSAEGRATFCGAHINARDTRISLDSLHCYQSADAAKSAAEHAPEM